MKYLKRQKRFKCQCVNIANWIAILEIITFNKDEISKQILHWKYFLKIILLSVKWTFEKLL